MTMAGWEREGERYGDVALRCVAGCGLRQLLAVGLGVVDVVGGGSLAWREIREGWMDG